MDQLNKKNRPVDTEYASSYVENGILHTYTKLASPSLEQVKNYMETSRAIFQDQLPLPCVIVSPHIQQTDKATRDYMASEEVASMVTATAVIMQNNNFARLAANLFLKFSNPTYPTKVFSNKEKAIEWLQQL